MVANIYLFLHESGLITDHTFESSERDHTRPSGIYIFVDKRRAIYLFLHARIDHKVIFLEPESGQSFWLKFFGILLNAELRERHAGRGHLVTVSVYKKRTSYKADRKKLVIQQQQQNNRSL